VVFSLGSVPFGYVTMAAAQQRGNAFILVSVARQRPVSDNREVFSLESVPRTRCRGHIVLLVQPELQEGEPMDCYLDVVGGTVPLRFEEGRPTAVRNKVAGKRKQQYY
jgi:hypothetical protein